MDKTMDNVARIHKEICTHQVFQGSSSGNTVKMFPIMGDWASKDVKFVLNVLVNPEFYKTLRCSKDKVIRKAVNFDVEPPTVYNVPIYIQHKQEEDFRVISR